MITARSKNGITRFRKVHDKGSDVAYVTAANDIYIYAKDMSGKVIHHNRVPVADRRTAIAIVSGFFGLPVQA